ncbi:MULTISPECIES: hypothetical protein [Methylorubrum]|jgi:hypothetical protein|uniref:Uncharacterized protein n=5 Tax=Methylorubrum extorquens TaxID=408 RepID=C5B1E4_METEA|nr:MULTISPECIES: hypothetical protein [Methylobacteriaceae]KQP95223.1 hypothetical protein ASF55_16565 [Methylobacterium sp. Leaf119]KQQ15694.1 hypothetical protein ASF59_15385 [Methylobacterium sp. Leaf121]MBA9070412.1 hypothetical protein [Methylobacterium sp. RAS18]MDF9863992.1 hypothetical protein [Methylorubrum pseudosasae]MDH6637585.1 hypothetical protein [Methylobacterium sp. SuP10 SLI 274]
MADAKTEREAVGTQPPGRPLGERSKPEAEPDLGPTGPASAEGEKPGPQSGGYDRQSPDRSTDNAKGGYGAG